MAPYAYVQNNPLLYNDPLGLDTIEVNIPIQPMIIFSGGQAQDFARYSKEQLRMFLNELEQGFLQRIKVTSQIGRDRSYGQRQGAEQDLIQSLEKLSWIINMKSIKEIQGMLVSELTGHLEKIKSADEKLVYYNQMLGSTSVLLAGLLQAILNKNFSEWDNRKWIDDSLLTKVVIEDNSLKIDGIMIWGKENTTEQWTEPFSFEIELFKEGESLKNFTFLFCDLDNPEITYEEFKDHRDYWRASRRSWKYIIKSDIVW